MIAFKIGAVTRLCGHTADMLAGNVAWQVSAGADCQAVYLDVPNWDLSELRNIIRLCSSSCG